LGSWSSYRFKSIDRNLILDLIKKCFSRLRVYSAPRGWGRIPFAPTDHDPMLPNGGRDFKRPVCPVFRAGSLVEEGRGEEVSHRLSRPFMRQPGIVARRQHAC